MDAKFIAKMKNELASEHETPEQLEGILEEYVEDREKHKEDHHANRGDPEGRCKSRRTSRISERQTAKLWREFNHCQGKERDLEVLEQLLLGLSFMRTYGQKERLLICEYADYLSKKPGEVIYKQGELEDNVYVVVKGRVALEVSSARYGGLPLVMALVSDGESFGHISLDEDLGNKIKTTDTLEIAKPKSKHTRPASSVAVEDTHLLVINKELMHQLNPKTS